MIIFENIDTKETYGIDRASEGKYYRAKLSALMNSSNMNVNADRGQDFGIRLIPEQQALIEQWETDPTMIEKVSNFAKVMVDDLTHAEFLSYLLYQQELGTSPENKQVNDRRDSQRDYELRVEALRVGKPKGMPAFEPKVARGEETLESFMNGDLTGDASGDKSTDEGQGVEPAKLGEAKTVVLPADAIAAKKAKAVAAKAADTTPKANEK
jgi:hypothetical protein